MIREEVMSKLQDIFVDVFDDENVVVSDTTSAVDIEGWDSLAHINILAAVQDEFKISFDLDEIVVMNNVGEMLDAIIKKM